jgi:glutamate carboxypeptidase
MREAEHPLLAWLRTQEPAMVQLLRELVRAESPSFAPGSHARAVELLEEALWAAGCATRRVGGNANGCHLYARPEHRVAGAPYQLLIGHFDTVWPLGSVDERPPRLEDGRLYGPGSYDAKGGLVQLVFALRALRANGLAPTVTPVVLANSDEEVGSADSARFITRLARGADRAFILEPPDGGRGRLKTSRKGVGGFRVSVHGRASHAGGSPERGVSAILELSHQIQRLYALNDRERGITVNVGTVDGGLRPNVVAPEATALVDVRAPTEADAERLEREIFALEPVAKGTSLSVTGGFLRPPMPQTARNHALCRRAQALGAQLGLHLDEAPLVGGGSDANLTSPLTATLDGLGSLGDGAHAEDEHVVVSALPERAALLALLLLEPARLRRGRRQPRARPRALAQLAP